MKKPLLEKSPSFETRDFPRGPNRRAKVSTEKHTRRDKDPTGTEKLRLYCCRGGGSAVTTPQIFSLRRMKRDWSAGGNRGVKSGNYFPRTISRTTSASSSKAGYHPYQLRTYQGVFGLSTIFRIIPKIFFTRLHWRYWCDSDQVMLKRIRLRNSARPDSSPLSPGGHAGGAKA